MKRLLPLLLAFSISAAFAADAPLSGKVVETRDVESYTYLRIATKSGDTWAAISKAPVKVGSEVTIEPSAVMTNFESKALNRKFDKVVFGSLAKPAAAATKAAAAPAQAAAQPTAAPAKRDVTEMHAGMALGKAADVGDVKVAKATGADARTVAEVITKKAELKDKPVVVHAKIVKFTPGILGKNWLHLRDGSGSAADGTNDVVVTTTDEAKVGDVVLVKGVVRTDRDLGSGYSYKVLVEDAKLGK